MAAPSKLQGLLGFVPSSWSGKGTPKCWPCAPWGLPGPGSLGASVAGESRGPDEVEAPQQEASQWPGLTLSQLPLPAQVLCHVLAL